MFQSMRMAIAVLLCAWAGASFSATYTWDSFFTTTTPNCHSLAQANADTDQRIGYDYASNTGGHPYMTIEVTSVTGYVRTVGDSCSFTLQSVNGATLVATVVPRTRTLTAIFEDDQADDVSGIPLQRVLVGVMCMVLWGIGWTAGRQL